MIICEGESFKQLRFKRSFPVFKTPIDIIIILWTRNINRSARRPNYFEPSSTFEQSRESVIFIITGHQDILDNSLSIKLRAGGMPATTARLVEACAPPTLNESQVSIRSLRHQRQVSDSVLKDLRDDDDDDDDDDEMETKSVGAPSTLPRLSRPSSIASPVTGSSKHNTLVC